jgi:hypothetical protein
MALLRQYPSPNILRAAKDKPGEFLLVIVRGRIAGRPLLDRRLVGQILLKELPGVTAAQPDHDRDYHNSNSAAAHCQAAHAAAILNIVAFPLVSPPHEFIPLFNGNSSQKRKPILALWRASAKKSAGISDRPLSLPG